MTLDEPGFCQCTCGMSGCASRRAPVQMNPRHGTVKRYRKGCRCERCSLARSRQHAAENRRRELATEAGSKRGQQWTGQEMEFVMRDDLSLTEIAQRLGRTYKAVNMMRIKCRREPKYMLAAGLSSEHG